MKGVDFVSHGTFDSAAHRVRASAAEAALLATEHQERLTKPLGSLGRLEDIGARLCSVSGFCPPPVPDPVTVAVFAGDHGVVAEGVTRWPQEVTAQMVANFCSGGGAVNVLSRHVGAQVVVVDVGVATDIPADSPSLLRRTVRRGTGNIAREPAMTHEQTTAALDIGAEVAGQAVADGARMLVTGEMGIGNTTPAAALIAAVTGRPAAEVTGRGTGIDDDMLRLKTAVVQRAVARLAPGTDARAALSEVGGLEIAALAGFIVGGAAARVPVMIDGVITCAAAVVACAMVPDVRGYLFAGHRSTEPGASVALSHLELQPALDLELRLGEGSGAVLAVPTIQAAAKILREMSTFDGAGVINKNSPESRS